MLVGTAQIDITPEPGIELVGFAERPQPSSAVLDPLAARAVRLQDGSEGILWLHVDLLALDQELVREVRKQVEQEVGIPAERVFISATHTHSGPASIRLTGCGEYQSGYVMSLKRHLLAAARQATQDGEPCGLWLAEGQCELGVDRRGFPSAHRDPLVGALGWRRSDGAFKAAVVVYGMHAVCLNRTQVSADWPGETARVLSESLPGRPVVLVCAGASGNINPPGVGVTPDQMRQWGREVARSVLPESVFSHVEPGSRGGQLLRVARRVLPLPLEPSTAKEISDYADASLAGGAGARLFSTKFRHAVDVWSRDMPAEVAGGKTPLAEVELFVMALGPVVLMGVNAEIFSRFTALAGEGAMRPVYTVSCANGMVGYIPTAEAYDEGGYEVEWALFFYHMLRPKRGSLESLAEHARSMITELESLNLNPSGASALTAARPSAP